MFAYLRLVRIYNLIFLGFIQFILIKAVLVPTLQIYGFSDAIELNILLLLIAASVFIAAGGYALNDYFDVKIDAINRPDKQIVGTIIPRRTAMILHQVLTGIGLICGLALAYFARSLSLAFIFIVVSGLLWFYSASYKRQLIVGNLIVAFIAGLAVLIVGITQMAFLQKEYGNFLFETPIPGNIYGWIGGFAAFSFLCTWIREIIKDAEDQKGDREMECHTMPIVWGESKTKLFLYGLITITIVALFLINNFYIPFDQSITFRYILFGIALPFLVVGYLIYTAKNPEDYHQASTLTKIIMLIGVFYSLIYYYLQAKTYGLSLFNLFIVK